MLTALPSLHPACPLGEIVAEPETYLCHLTPVVDRVLEAPAQGALGIPAPQQLADLAVEGSHIGLAGLG